MNARSVQQLSKAFLEWHPKKWIGISESTKEYLTYWAGLGEQEGYTVWTHRDYYPKSHKSDPEREREYMVDLSWSFEDDFGHYWLELALESELSNDSIEGMMYDFYKLIDIKSYTKIGIFYPKLKDKDDFIINCAETIAYSGIKIPFENYLLILIIDHGVKENPERSFQVETYHIDYMGTITKEGSIRFSDAQ